MNEMDVIQARTILMWFQTQLGLFKFEMERKDFECFSSLVQMFRLKKALCVEKHPESENLSKNSAKASRISKSLKKQNS